jgi:hypothetical protein
MCFSRYILVGLEVAGSSCEDCILWMVPKGDAFLNVLGVETIIWMEQILLVAPEAARRSIVRVNNLSSFSLGCRRLRLHMLCWHRFVEFVGMVAGRQGSTL